MRMNPGVSMTLQHRRAERSIQRDPVGHFEKLIEARKREIGMLKEREAPARRIAECYSAIGDYYRLMAFYLTKEKSEPVSRKARRRPAD